MAQNSITVAYFGNYDPSYTRVRTVLKGLKRAGFEIIECSNNHHSRLIRLLILTIKYLRIAHRVDLMMVSEAGQAYVPLGKVLSLMTGKPLLVDVFLSYYHIHVIDSKRVTPRSLKARYFFYLDKLACVLADQALLDTEEHAEYFSKEFKIGRSKFRILPVGSDDNLFVPYSNGNGARKKFRVFLVTSFYPLHGVEHVIYAAKLLEHHDDIEFFIVGNGPMRQHVDRVSQTLGVKNILFRGIVPPYILPDLMVKSDVCLGHFGNTLHAHMVVPAKAYDAIAMRKPLITGAGTAVKTVFTDSQTALLIPFADPHALADAILRLKNDVTLREIIAENGHRLFQEKFSLERTGAQLATIIHDLINTRS